MNSYVGEKAWHSECRLGKYIDHKPTAQFVNISYLTRHWDNGVDKYLP